ncbi:hypothetical protein [Nocardia sp. NPDC051570]|uniref:hypothetical protein n=1 Tax=Nocardia sp. NPDC051570 TaxID=3364324 RepID=UPI0037B60FC6
MPALSPQDATTYWLSRRTGNDQFLLYGFDETGRSTRDLRALLAHRAARIPDLGLRVRERRFAYPVWAPGAVDDEQIVEHELPDSHWSNVVAALGDVVDERLRAEERAWRLHLYRAVRDAPAGDGPAVIAVLQLSHALADGRRATAITRSLFAAELPPDDAARSTAFPTGTHTLKDAAAELVSFFGMPIALGRTMIRGLAADRARRELAAAPLAERLRRPLPKRRRHCSITGPSRDRMRFGCWSVVICGYRVAR